jgi:hypothetical protein
MTEMMRVVAVLDGRMGSREARMSCRMLTV